MIPWDYGTQLGVLVKGVRSNSNPASQLPLVALQALTERCQIVRTEHGARRETDADIASNINTTAGRLLFFELPRFHANWIMETEQRAS